MWNDPRILACLPFGCKRISKKLDISKSFQQHVLHSRFWLQDLTIDNGFDYNRTHHLQVYLLLTISILVKSTNIVIFNY